MDEDSDMDSDSDMDEDFFDKKSSKEGNPLWCETQSFASLPRKLIHTLHSSARVVTMTGWL